MTGLLARERAGVSKCLWPASPHDLLVRLVTVMAWLCVAGQFTASAGGDDPAVPAGIDPRGGLRVALLGDGIDYLADDVHIRLARDGEGEIIGYDFIDDDRRPFAAPGDTAIARIILAEGQATTLVAVRTNFNSVAALAQSLGFVVKGPARIVVLLHQFNDANFISLIRAVAPRFPRHLFVIEAGDEGIDLDPLTAEEAKNLANVLVVTACDDNGELRRSANVGKGSVDVAVPTPELENETGSRPMTTALATARVAALAARITAVDDTLDGAGLKAKIIEIAQPFPRKPEADTNVVQRNTRSGWIKEPRRPFWLE